MSKYDKNNIFNKILAGKIPSAKVFENDYALVIMDVMPVSRGHCLVIPKAPSRNLLDADAITLSNIMPIVQQVAQATKKALQADGIIIQQFNEENAGQIVFHLHFHIIPTFAGQKPTQHADKMADPKELKEIAALIAAQVK